jgi:hypothetical protein
MFILEFIGEMLSQVLYEKSRESKTIRWIPMALLVFVALLFGIVTYRLIISA